MLLTANRRLSQPVASLLQLPTEETEQEKFIENEITPLHLRFWRPSNILSVEDTPFSKRYLVTLLIISFSILGNLARISLQKLTNYGNSYINYSGGTVVWVNFAASFTMSWCNNSVKFWSYILENSGKTSYKELTLHSGLSVGFCGSFSTFSGAIIEIFFLTLDLTTHQLPNSGYRVMEFFSATITAFAIPAFGHILGIQFALFFDKYIVSRISKILTYRNIRILELGFVLSGIIALIANLILTCVLSVDYWYKNTYSFAILIGAFGALLRFHLSRFNGKFFQPWFPTGTLMANVIGCTLIAISELLTHGLVNDDQLLINNKIHRFILDGFLAGFCGSLTTMSSFINELYNLEHPWYQHIYFWSTFITCFLIVILIDGSYAWSRGFVVI